MLIKESGVLLWGCAKSDKVEKRRTGIASNFIMRFVLVFRIKKLRQMAVIYKFREGLLFSTILVFLCSCGKQFHFTSSKEAATDTSYVYTLPYPEGKSHLLVQGYNSSFSHRGRLGLDFKMNSGSPVTAARDGIVVGTEENFTKGGINKKFYHKANYVIVRHSDGTQ